MAESIVGFESQVVIQRSIADTFERLADLPAYGVWMHRNGLFRRCRLTSDAPVRAGTTYVDATWMGTFEGEVTEFEPSAVAAFTGMGLVSGLPRGISARRASRVSRMIGRCLIKS